MSYVDDHMTLAAWGLTHGMSRQGAHDAAKRYNFPRREDGKVSKAVCDALYAARARPRVKTRSTTPAEGEAEGYVSYQEARRREAVARAVLAEREAAVQAGQLVEVEKVLFVLGRRYSVARDRLLGIPSRIAPQAAGLDAHQAEVLIEQEIVDALAEISGASDDLRASVPGAA